MQTPWGSSQHIDTIAQGISLVSTASHGGYKVNDTLNMKIPDWLKESTHNQLGFDGWYEEDVDSCIPVLIYANQFRSWANSQGGNPDVFITVAESCFVKHVLPSVKMPSRNDKLDRPGLYLNLYHGRKDLSEDLDGWGSEGPLIGPLTRLKMTYLNCISLTFEEELDALRYNLGIELPELTTKEDCVEYQGVFYGDWSLEYHSVTKL